MNRDPPHPRPLSASPSAPRCSSAPPPLLTGITFPPRIMPASNPLAATSRMPLPPALSIYRDHCEQCHRSTPWATAAKSPPLRSDQHQIRHRRRPRVVPPPGRSRPRHAFLVQPPRSAALAAGRLSPVDSAVAAALSRSAGKRQPSQAGGHARVYPDPSP